MRQINPEFIPANNIPTGIVAIDSNCGNMYIKKGATNIKIGRSFILHHVANIAQRDMLIISGCVDIMEMCTYINASGIKTIDIWTGTVWKLVELG